jgi:hypothetical protein
MSPRPSVSFKATISLGGAGFLSISPSEIVQPGPITAAGPPRIRRRHAPLTRGLEAGGMGPDSPPLGPSAGTRPRGAFVRTNAITGRDVLPPLPEKEGQRRLLCRGQRRREDTLWRPSSCGRHPAGDIRPGAPVLAPPRRMGEGLPLSPAMRGMSGRSNAWARPDRLGASDPGGHRPRIGRAPTPRVGSRGPVRPQSRRSLLGPKRLRPRRDRADRRRSARLRCRASPLLATEDPYPPRSPVSGQKRARREAVIGPYPDVLVPDGSRGSPVLQGDALPRRCQLFRVSREGDTFQLGPITAARPPRIRRRHAPSPEP